MYVFMEKQTHEGKVPEAPEALTCAGNSVCCLAQRCEALAALGGRSGQGLEAPAFSRAALPSARPAPQAALSQGPWPPFPARGCAPPPPAARDSPFPGGRTGLVEVSGKRSC